MTGTFVSLLSHHRLQPPFLTSFDQVHSHPLCSCLAMRPVPDILSSFKQHERDHEDCVSTGCPRTTNCLSATRAPARDRRASDVSLRISWSRHLFPKTTVQNSFTSFMKHFCL